ncbi:AlpA family phage regulatory protein [Pseudomonas asplenii]|uniref:AlpA family phage regulatory protein n=1 Tax=Pseudomonas asplenii TaxID=53407 RepID=UPI0037C597CB
MRIIRLKDVIDLTGIARSTIYKLIGERGFPKPVPPGRSSFASLCYDRCLEIERGRAAVIAHWNRHFQTVRGVAQCQYEDQRWV